MFCIKFYIACLRAGLFIKVLLVPSKFCTILECFITNFVTLTIQVLVRKVYGDRGKRHRTRNWKLQQLNKEVEENMDTGNYDRLPGL